MSHPMESSRYFLKTPEMIDKMAPTLVSTVLFWPAGCSEVRSQVDERLFISVFLLSCVCSLFESHCVNIHSSYK
jgi:hypothetical protein